jgi:alpha-mannosidase
VHLTRREAEPVKSAPEIVVVPHTHWDREWYLPFQRFRLGLVRMLDEVLDTMAADPGYRFTMDGQLAALEDYLEIRPERRALLAELVAEGRLAAGPWQILADSFLCAGETLIRNLEYGMRGARALGRAMPVGYLPDQFGHCAQMPQILTQAGLAHACLWRGVPAHVDRDAFIWTGADGTAIHTRYLATGYGNAVAMFSGPPGALPDRLAAFTEAMRPWHPTGPMLAMHGADHSAPAADITAAGLRLATLDDYVTDDHGETGLPEVHGELRSHARANILPGVISARIPAKRAMARAERAVTRYAEPLSTLWLPGHSAVTRLLDMAWRRLIACSGHDSITGCGADETAQQVAARIAEAEQIGQAAVDMVGAELAGATPRGDLVVVNPSPHRRTGLVLADLREDRADLGVPTQRLELAPTLLDEIVTNDLTVLLGRVHESELFGFEIVSWEAGDQAFTVTVGRHASPGYDYADLRAAVLAAGAGPGPWTVRVVAEPVVTVAALVTVPPLGRTVLTATAQAPSAGSYGGTASDPGSTADSGSSSGLGSGPGSDLGPGPGFGPADGVSGARVLDNGLLRVTVAEDGTLSLRTPSGLRADGIGRIVDGGDAGDTYNHAPPATDRLIDEPTWVKVEEVCTGPLVSAVEITRGYAWPVDSSGESRSTDTGPVRVTTRAELRAGEPYLRLETTFDNRCHDHRVRWHAPLPTPATESFAEGQLCVVRRGLTAEGGGGEHPIPTFPAEGFVTAGGLAVLLDQVTEYELVTGPTPEPGPAPEPGAGPAPEPGAAGELAVTLVRSVGYLSRNRNAYRDEPAGPQLATPEAQCPGVVTTRFAVHLHDGPWHASGLLRLAEEYRHDLLAVPGSGSAPRAGDLARVVPGPVEVAGEGVVMAALRERDGALEVRLVAEHPVPTEAVLSGPFAAAYRAGILGDRGRPLALTPGSPLRIPLRPFEILTVHLIPAAI